MTSEDEVVKVLIRLESEIGHEDKCPGRKKPESCDCYQLRNARLRASALYQAGLIKGDENELG